MPRKRHHICRKTVCFCHSAENINRVKHWKSPYTASIIPYPQHFHVSPKGISCLQMTRPNTFSPLAWNKKMVKKYLYNVKEWKYGILLVCFHFHYDNGRYNPRHEITCWCHMQTIKTLFYFILYTDTPNTSQSEYYKGDCIEVEESQGKPRPYGSQPFIIPADICR